MNIALWIAQILLAVAFGLAGVMKLLQPREKLLTFLPWVEDFSTGTVRFIAAAELAGSLGLLLPAVTGIATWLTPIAAAALAVVMILAAYTHVRRKEPSGTAFTLLLFALATFVAWGRFGTYSL